jgi:hypothetical protein
MTLKPAIHRLSPARKDWLAILLLLAITCIAYWPLAFHVFSLKNDALNYFMPVRFQISEAISSHHYPFWSPYFNLGYALNGDMQSGVWNPFVQFFSLFGPYTLYTLQLETLLYIFLSGAGMYLLLRQMRMPVTTALFAAVAYMLCGFNSDCCQYLNWISSAAFLPFVVLFYYKTLKGKKLVHSLAAGFFLYLMFVTAYPAHFIVALYLLAAIFVYHVVLQLRAGSRLWTLLTTSFFSQLPLILCFVILSAPAILSYIQYLQLSERGEGTTYAKAMSNPLHPLLLLAYFTPLPIHNMPWVTVTDGLERNSYFGIITFVFTLTSFFIRTTDPRIRFSRTAFLIFQLMSLGQFGGLRSLAYYLLPLMDTFRHPAGMKIFTIFFGCILAAWSMQEVITQRQVEAKLKPVLLFSLTILAGLFIYSLTGGSGITEIFNGVRSALAPASLKNWLGTRSFKDILLADSLLQLGFMILLFFLLLRKRHYKAVAGLSIFNCVLYVFFFTPFTVVKKDRAASIQHILDQNTVKGYPLPSLTTSLAANSAGDSSRFYDIGCLNMYNKLPGRNGYRISPCNLLSQNKFWFDTAFRKAIMGYPLLYRPDTLVPHSQWAAVLAADPGRRIGVVEDSSLRAAISAPTADTGSLAVTAFGPDHFKFSVTSGQPAYHILLQNYYPLWKLYIDGKEAPITISNTTFMGVRTPAGSHMIEFIYRPVHIIIAFWLSLAATLLLLAWFAAYRPPTS